VGACALVEKLQIFAMQFFPFVLLCRNLRFRVCHLTAALPVV
jgi:hypothetical protein